MKNVLILSLFALVAGGCATQTAPVAPRPTSRTYSVPFDQVWGSVVSEVSAVCPVQSIEKSSGLITTQMMSFGGGYSGWQTLRGYAYEPKIFLSTWNGGARCSLTFYVSSVDGTNTSVRVTGRFEGFEDNVTHGWQFWQSNGAYENQFLDKFATTLGL